MTDTLLETSEIGFGFGDEGYVLIVPNTFLADTNLLSLGSRLTRKALIVLENENQMEKTLTLLAPLKEGRRLNVDSYLSNAKRTSSAIEELSRYTLLAVVICLMLGGITLFSALEGYFSKLRPVFGVGSLL